MADGRRLKASAGGREEQGGEREEVELALSLGRSRAALESWARRSPVMPVCDSDAAGSSSTGAARTRGVVPPPAPVSLLRFCDGSRLARGEAEVGAEASHRIVKAAEDEEDGDWDSQPKRPKVVGYGEASPQHATATLPLYGFKTSSLPEPDEHGPLKLPLLRESELDYCLTIFPNDGGSETQEDANNEVVGHIDKSGRKNSEEVEIKMDLSDDLLHLIFSFLDQKDLCLAGTTCKHWQSASTHEDFWKCLMLENTTISLENFVAICHRYQNITELNMCGVSDAELLVLEAIPFLRSLQTLTMGKGLLGEGFFEALTNCPMLSTLSISDASLGTGIHEVTVHHDGLCELQIVKCRALRISVRCSQLQTLSLRRTGMAHVSLNCPQLHELDLQSCHKLCDNALRQAATSCPLLASLDMSSCSCVTDETLREIANSCANLSVLDASNCPNISFEWVRLPMLVDLKLLSCEGITSASMTAISYSRMLEALQLDNCSLLTSISLDLPHLRSISLVHLRKFADLNLRSPVLSYVKVSRCSALRHISITSNSLQKLVLQKQESLASLSLQCYNLIDVDLSDCESLTNAICEVFSDGGGCPMLRSLALDNCESLSIVELSSSSLSNLSLAGCRAMMVLNLSCPNLQKVNLDGCDHLERAAFCPVGLESLNLGICPKLKVLRISAPTMSVLELKGCGMLSQASINCPFLASLDASFCRQLMDSSLSRTVETCPIIENLILSSCLSISVDGLSSLNCLHKLTLLDLSYTFLINLQSVFNTCSQLKVLKLSACKYLSDSSLDPLYRHGALPKLIELDLSYSSIGQAAIQELLACCPNLVNVNLNGCANLHELVSQSKACGLTDMPVDICPSNSIHIKNEETNRKSERLLEVLSCTGCPNIKKVVIPSSANFLHLSKISLNLSTNLKEVDLTCSNLCCLNLSNCSSLEVLKLDCPRLANLQLQACSILQEEELESAISCCNMLEILNVDSCPKINALHFGRLHMVCPSLKRIQSSVIA